MAVASLLLETKCNVSKRIRPTSHKEPRPTTPSAFGTKICTHTYIALHTLLKCVIKLLCAWTSTTLTNPLMKLAVVGGNLFSLHCFHSLLSLLNQSTPVSADCDGSLLISVKRIMFRPSFVTANHRIRYMLCGVYNKVLIWRTYKWFHVHLSGQVLKIFPVCHLIFPRFQKKSFLWQRNLRMVNKTGFLPLQLRYKQLFMLHTRPAPLISCNKPRPCLKQHTGDGSTHLYASAFFRHCELCKIPFAV